MSSTETWTRGSFEWTPAADLPSPRSHMAGVSIGGHFLITGLQCGVNIYNSNISYVIIRRTILGVAPVLDYLVFGVEV